VSSALIDTSKWQVLLKPVSDLHRIGPATSDLLKKLRITRVGDLLLHFPVDVIDRTTLTPLSQTQDGEIATTIVKVRCRTVG
jgi:RecG-like helicase